MATTPSDVASTPGDPSGKRPVGRPRDARADRAILTSALELMAEDGVHAFRIDDVARRAGVGKATIYRRYRSKEQLATEAVGALVGEEIEIPDSGSTRSDLLALMRDAVELYSGTLAAKLMPSVFDEMSRNEKFAEIGRHRFLTPRRTALRAVFESGIKRGELRADIDIELALDVLAGPLFYRLIVTGGPIDEGLASGIVELLLRGFAPVAARAAKPPKTKDRSK
jgi:AcrR family transcriptional regulator